MAVAQQLYEGIELGDKDAVGLITYMRTDSTRIASQAQEEARKYIVEKFQDNQESPAKNEFNYLPPKPPVYKSPKRAQEAHEAVRPTSAFRDMGRVRTYLSPDQAKLYELIWKRFIASQMAPAQIDQTSVDIGVAGYTFRAGGSVLRFEGYRKVYRTEKGEQKILPDLKQGQELQVQGLDPKQHFTQPPPRFTDASLVKELEEKGIGRPSTYASILSVIQNKSYAQRNKSRFAPTELGMIVTDLLVESFPDLLNEAFTAQMEADLDLVEEGKAGWKDTLERFYGPFNETLSLAKTSMADLKRKGIPTDIKCPACGAEMVIRLGRNGQFLACSAYPECKTTGDFTRDEDGRIIPESPEAVDLECPTCGQPMIKKSGRYGKFLACSAYPECQTTLPLDDDEERPKEEPTDEVCDKCGAPMVIKTSRGGGRFLACTAYPKCKNAKGIPVGVDCPKENCSGHLVERASKRGKLFFGCSEYPKCDYVVWNRPVNKPCPVCGHPHLVRKDLKKGSVLACPKKSCSHSEPVQE